MKINNKLLYCSDTERSYTKKTEGIANNKIASMDLQISRFEALPLKNAPSVNSTEILPRSEKKFTMQTEIPMLAMGKSLECGLLIEDTIVSRKNNIIRVC